MVTTSPVNSEEKTLNLDAIRLDPTATIHRENNPQFIAAIARGLEVLRCFSTSHQLLGNQDLAQMTGLPKPTIARITSTLVVLGYLKQLPNTTKYMLDIGVLALGYAALASVPARLYAHRYMQEMADYAQAPVAMATRDRLHMVYLEVIQTQNNLTMRRPVGSTLPLYNTAMGRACLAALSEKERDFILAALAKHHPNDWHTIERGIEQAISQYKTYGYCLSLGEWHKEVNSVAVPLIDPVHGLYVFNCGAPSYIMVREKLEKEIGPRLIHMVQNIKYAIDTNTLIG